MGSIDTMLNTFIKPLQDLADAQSRVHCFSNLNKEFDCVKETEPRTSRPRQGPLFDRKAFKAGSCSLIVADYGQLELRLLAHVAKCESMLSAFREGGCFHSRTAVGMFDHVRQAVENGEVLLEKGTQGDSDKPLVKDKYAAERRRAKTLNFSIAYGKTAHGLAKDWGVSQQEAQSMLRAWYDDRPEVERWQKDTIAAAPSFGLYYYADGSTSTVAGSPGTESRVAGARRAGGDQHADSGERRGRRHDGHARYW